MGVKYTKDGNAKETNDENSCCNNPERCLVEFVHAPCRGENGSDALEQDGADLTFALNELFGTFACQICVDYQQYLQFCIDLYKKQPSVYNFWRMVGVALDPPVLTHGFDLDSPSAVDRIFLYYDNWYEANGDREPERMVHYSKRKICKTVYPFIVLTAQTRAEVVKVFDGYRTKFTVKEWRLYPRTFITFYFNHLVHTKTQ